jgi:hypothetical protein
VSWNVPAPALTYQWFADGTAIPGATGATFVPTAAQIDQRIEVVERATSPGYVAATARSARTSPVTYGVVAFTGRPSITGRRLLGAVLTAHVPASRPGGASLSFQWFRGSTPIRGATAATYRTVTADVARHLSVRVTGAAASWTSSSIRSDRYDVIRSVPVVRASASVGGKRHRFATIALRIKAPGVERVHGVAVVFEGEHRLGRAYVRQGRATVRLGTLRAGKHHLIVRFHAAGASKSGTAKVVVVAG